MKSHKASHYSNKMKLFLSCIIFKDTFFLIIFKMLFLFLLINNKSVIIIGC
jgi:hypothetical protein